MRLSIPASLVSPFRNRVKSYRVWKGVESYRICFFAFFRIERTKELTVAECFLTAAWQPIHPRQYDKLWPRASPSWSASSVESVPPPRATHFHPVIRPAASASGLTLLSPRLPLVFCFPRISGSACSSFCSLKMSSRTCRQSS
jgi:hypothetical protein